MKLYYPFSDSTRALFLYHQKCYLCGGNGTNRGGLELHHICGRRKTGVNLDSPFNASVLCGYCHKNISHSIETQKTLFFKTIKILIQERYHPQEYDADFLRENSEAEFGCTAEEIVDEMWTV